MRRLLRWLATLASLAGLSYVGWTLAGHWAELVAALAAPRVLAAIGVHAAALALLALGWALCLRGAAATPLSLVVGMAVYGRSLVLKYLPGNAFHFIGRQALIADLGIGQRAGMLASTAEIGLLILSAALLTLVFAAGLDGAPGGAPGGAALAPAIILASLAAPIVWAGLALAPRHPRLARLGPLRVIGELAVSRHALAALPCVLGFFLANLAVVWLIAGPGSPDLPSLAVAYLSGWLLGFIVPGAPGGLGVREAAIIMLLAPKLGEGGAAALATLLRLVNLGGEAMLWAFAHAIRLESQRP